MSPFRKISQLAVAVSAVFNFACTGPTPPMPPPTAKPPPPATAAEALTMLRKAHQFEDTHVGFDGALSDYVAAFRVVLADPNAGAMFHELVDHATPAGRLYGAAGIYFADPPAFDAALGNLVAAGGSVKRRMGCMGFEEPVATVVRSAKPNRIEIGRGDTLDAWFKRHPNGNECDLAGGCIPLMFVADGRAAPRDPVK